MLPNNNFSPLPFYESLAEQNARKWWLFGKVYPLYAQGGFLIPFQIMLPAASGRQGTGASFSLYRADGSFVRSLSLTIHYYTVGDLCFYVYNGSSSSGAIDNGRYYIRFSDSVSTLYSEIFTVVNDTEPFLRINWYDREDLVMDAGRIIYRDGYSNILYLQADLAKPEYLFTEEGEERDGYYYPLKQISEKRYRFKFWASEYLLDVMRFIRMSDYVTITYRGKSYQPDTFLLTPEWEAEGDVASVQVEFDTATVAKKIGLGYLRGLRGDFNADYNDDFDNREQAPEEETEG